MSTTADAPITDTAREEEVGPEWCETHEKSVSGCSIRIILVCDPVSRRSTKLATDDAPRSGETTFLLRRNTVWQE